MEMWDWDREEVAREAFGHRKMERNFFSAFLDLKYFEEDVKIATLFSTSTGKSEKIKYSSTRGDRTFFLFVIYKKINVLGRWRTI